MKLTQRAIRSLSAPIAMPNQSTVQTIVRDAYLPGFGVRITHRGAKSYIVEKRVNGKNRRITLGRVEQLELGNARKEAFRLLQQMSLGVDPVLERQKQHKKPPTLQDAYHSYLLARKNLSPDTLKDYERTMCSALGDWKKKPITSITKFMVEKRHRDLGAKGPARANNAMRVLRAIMNHARVTYEDEHGDPLLKENPVNRLSEIRAWYTIKPRERIIKTHQLKAWFEATLKLDSDIARDYLQLLLFTGLRRKEAATLKWTDIDFKEKTLTIRETKNHCTHTLPLTGVLIELFEQRRHQRLNEYVFPSTRGCGYYKKPEMAINRVIELSGVEFSLHDLRRTFITIAEGLNTPGYVLKRLLNHKNPNDVTESYIISNVERLRLPMIEIHDYINAQTGIARL